MPFAVDAPELEWNRTEASAAASRESVAEIRTVERTAAVLTAPNDPAAMTDGMEVKHQCC